MNHDPTDAGPSEMAAAPRIHKHPWGYIDESEGYTTDLSCLEAVAGEDVFGLIMAKAPPTVLWRVAKAADHYNKAKRLLTIDDEMGAIRLIAAEEELVVAIFKWLELNPTVYPEVGSILRQFKQHRVKLSFYPALRQFEFALGHLAEGFTLPGLEGKLAWRAEPVVEGETILLRIVDQDGTEIIRVNPLMMTVCSDGMTADEVISSLFERFNGIVHDQQGIDIKTFLENRAVFRDRLLYAYDEVPVFSMNETLEQLFALFDETLSRLLLVLAILLANDPPSTTWGIVAQFVALYRRVLAEAGHGKPGPPVEAPSPDDFHHLEFKAL